MGKLQEYYREILERLKNDYDHRPGNNPPFNDDYIFTANTGLEFVLTKFSPLGQLGLLIEYAEKVGGQRTGFEDGDLFFISGADIDELYRDMKAEIEDSIEYKK